MGIMRYILGHQSWCDRSTDCAERVGGRQPGCGGCQGAPDRVGASKDAVSTGVVRVSGGVTVS